MDIVKFKGAKGAWMGAVQYRVPSAQLKRGVVIYLNGNISHAGWFAASAKALVDQGYEVICLDRRGSGINREEAGFATGDVDRIETLLADIHCCIKDLCGDERRLYLCGGSWGGRLSLVYGLRYPDTIAGMILITPALKFPRPVAFSMKAKLFWRHILTAGKGHLPYPIQAANFSDQSECIRYIETDKLRADYMCTNFMMRDLRLERDLQRDRVTFDKPVLLLLAGQDKIIHNAAIERVAREKCPHLQIITYHKNHHALQLEEPVLIAQDMGRWMRDGVVAQEA